MDSRFPDFRDVLSQEMLNELEPKKKNKFIAGLKLKYPKEGALLESKKLDLIELLEKHNKENKEGAYLELLEIKGIYLILGLELPELYDINDKKKKQVSRYIGNYISRKLYHKYGWGDTFSNVKNALFSVVELKKIES